MNLSLCNLFFLFNLKHLETAYNSVIAEISQRGSLSNASVCGTFPLVPLEQFVHETALTLTPTIIVASKHLYVCPGPTVKSLLSLRTKILLEPLQSPHAEVSLRNIVSLPESKVPLMTFLR